MKYIKAVTIPEKIILPNGRTIRENQLISYKGKFYMKGAISLLGVALISLDNNLGVIPGGPVKFLNDEDLDAWDGE